MAVGLHLLFERPELAHPAGVDLCGYYSNIVSLALGWVVGLTLLSGMLGEGTEIVFFIAKVESCLSKTL